ncbi:MAG: TrkH family potassium uptake protein [Rikenellaceae bacterium]
MRFSIISRYTGLAILLNAVFMLVSAMVSLFNGIDTAFYPLLLSTLLTVIVGSFPLIFVPGNSNIKNKEGYIIVVVSWVISSIVGMLPYLLWGGEFTLVNSFFESISGYTTTGASILQNVEALPRGLLFWRSSTHTIGGAGIIIFALAVMPSANKAKLSLSNIELSSLAKDNYRYRIDKVVRILLFIYATLISSETICLRLAGMDWFDAINHSMSTIATGGFSTRNMSIASYNNIWIEVIIMVFMAFSGLHFGLLFATLTRKKMNLFSSEVSRYYFTTILVGTIVITLNLFATDTYSLFDSLRFASFQFISIITTTGYATVDTGMWPSLSVLVLIFYTFHCACAGSTTGGLKADRFLILVKVFRARTLKMQHPNAIIKIKLNKMALTEDLTFTVLVFVALYIVICLIFTLILTAMGIDLTTSFTAAAASLGNVGPGFGDVSSLSNFASLPSAAKMTCAFAMLLGRLELFGFIQIFLMKSWR